MADIDDFEIINETSLSNEQTFEVIDVNGVTEEKINTNTPTTPDIVLPLLIPKPVVDETSQVVQQQTPTPIVNSPEPKESHSPVKTTIPVTPFVPIKRTIQSPPPPIIFAPVPPLPKAPPLPRYGGAASIPHNLDASFNIDTIIDKSRKAQQTTLNISAQQQQKDIDIIIDKSRKAQQTTLNISTQQQQKDIQTILEQRRKLLNKK
jgi:hypothetical protein